MGIVADGRSPQHQKQEKKELERRDSCANDRAKVRALMVDEQQNCARDNGAEEFCEEQIADAAAAPGNHPRRC
jgi:hypothetical protein